MIKWIEMCEHYPNLGLADELEQIASFDTRDEAYICWGVAQLIRGDSKAALAELQKSSALDSENWDGYFWQGIILAKLREREAAIVSLNKALELDLPPILLLPLRWLEQDAPDFYEQYAKELLAKYELLW